MARRRQKIYKELIDQTFLNERHQPFQLSVVPECKADASYLDWLLDGAKDGKDSESRAIGIHIAYTKLARLAALAICTDKKVLLVTEVMKTASKPSQQTFRRALLSKVLSVDSPYRVAAFNAHELVLALHRDMNLTCAYVVDLLSLPPGNRDVVATLRSIRGAKLELYESAIRDAFKETIYKPDGDSSFAQQAWLACIVGNLPEAQRDLARIAPIDSSAFSKPELDALSRNIQGLLLRDGSKVDEETIDVSGTAFQFHGDKVSWEQDNFSKRIRNSPHQVVKASVDGHTVLRGTVQSTQGKKAAVKLEDLDAFRNPNLQSIMVVGRATQTKAEQHHARTILDTLQKKTPTFNDRWVKRLFCPSEPGTPKPRDEMHSDANTSESNDPSCTIAWGTAHGWSTADRWAADDAADAQMRNDTSEDDAGWPAAGDDPWSSFEVVQDHPNEASSTEPPYLSSPQDSLYELQYKGPLNPSQASAVHDMLDASKDVTMIQGPPGTGKTTVICAYVVELLSRQAETCLIVAQSNVALKNVAEKLANIGVSDWIVVVSSDFLEGWHEHLYKQIPSTNLLASKDMKGFLRTRIVLCTISMLSNDRFCNATNHLAFESIIVEEASQIPMNSFLPVIAHYGSDIKKFNFIGDNQQLAPYRSENLEVLDSVFENTVLLDTLNVKMLNIQYRMPPAIGDFISEEVYNGWLSTWDAHPVYSLLATQFLNVNGVEEPAGRSSFQNLYEAAVAIEIASILYDMQLLFKIITPYEPQRDLLENLLKDAGLQWANTCFTVDSFQGNEADYIIVSIVRTRSVGFLQDIRRSNVMLTRAKRGMFICSNKTFLQSPGARNTLVGRMAEQWTYIDDGWVEDLQYLAKKLHIE